MRKTLLVLKNEIITVISRRSFILTLVLVPLVSFLVMLVVSALQQAPGGSGGLSGLISSPPGISLEGFVDQSGLVKTLPKNLAKSLEQFSTLDEAKKALRIGEISAYYVISPDYLSSGRVIYVRPDFNPLGGLTQSSVINGLLEYNLLNGNQSLLDRLHNAMSMQAQTSDRQPAREGGNAMTFILPYIVTMFFYIIILTSASLLLSSISSEKENRVMEVMMTSVTPLQLLEGKIVALGLIGLLQTLFWGGAGLLLLRLGGQTFNLSAAFQLPISILAWGALFFLLGYGLYGSLMAGLGALVPNLREASQATTVIILPLIVPLVLINNLINDSNGTLSVILSLFPFTAPVSMMTRLSAGAVPVWQPILAAILLLGTIMVVVRAVAGMFRAQNLLSGQGFRIGLFFKELFGRA